jgi:hypothetical protein
MNTKTVKMSAIETSLDDINASRCSFIQNYLAVVYWLNGSDADHPRQGSPDFI